MTDDSPINIETYTAADAAIAAFYKRLEDAGLDGAYWNIKIIVSELDCTLTEIMHRVTVEPHTLPDKDNGDDCE